MSLAGRRDANEAEIAKALLKAGCTIDYAHRKAYDMICARAGVNYLIEVKSRSGRLTDSQDAFRRTWGGHYAIVRTPEEALKAVGLK